jgi:glycosyltransferase involved in cell wall biosynthesis
MINGVSVIICCYNSVSRLPKTLLNLANQINVRFDWEVLIVNNNSTDCTTEVAYAEWRKYEVNCPLTIIDEVVPGLSNARRRGVQHAKYDYILFCDDDNWLDNNYLQIGYDFLLNNPQCGIVGGWSTAVSSTEFPPWFETQQFCFAVGRPYSHTRDITADGQVWGAGMFTRRKVLNIVFDKSFPFLCSDRKGNMIMSGGDDEICMRVALLGLKLYHHEELHFIHEIPAGRLTESYLDLLYAGFAFSAPIFMHYQILNKVKNMNVIDKITLFVLHLVKLLSTLLISNRTRKLYSRSVLYYLTGLNYFSNETTRYILKYNNYAEKQISWIQ